MHAQLEIRNLQITHALAKINVRVSAVKYILTVKVIYYYVLV